MKKNRVCPHCRGVIEEYKNPFPTVDVIIYDSVRGIVLIKRKNTPLGYALPGGFVDYGETIQQAALREAFEETGLEIELQGLLGVYSERTRDERFHSISSVFYAKAVNVGSLHAGDDAIDAEFFSLENIPNLVFDHKKIVGHFIEFLYGNRTISSPV